MKSKKKKNKGGSSGSKQLCLSLPINIEREELIVLSKRGSILDDSVVRDALVMAFTTSLRIADDAINKVHKALEGYSARKINIFIHEQVRLDNTVIWERPAECIEIQVRGLVFTIWASRELRRNELICQDDLLMPH